MRAFYNEIDRYCCDWLQSLMDAELITPGKIDDRSITELTPDDCRQYDRCHFFAGIAGWELALQMSGYAGPVWTGSCPCQPFSAAGKGKASGDERHLWPEWFRLISAIRPPIIFGEQVEAAIGWGWLDLVYSDLEAEGYTVGSAVLPACSIGAPHIRQRLWFVADTNGRDASTEWLQRGGEQRFKPQDSGTSELADASHNGWSRQQGTRQRGPSSAHHWADCEWLPCADGREPDRLADASQAGELADADPSRCGERWAREASDGRNSARFEPTGLCVDGVDYPASARQLTEGQGAEGEAWDKARMRVPGHGCWQDLLWLPCTDGKQRPTQPGIFPLAHGVSGRVAKLRAAGNAIVPQVAAEFIKASINQ